jgi:hypothetical protein
MSGPVSRPRSWSIRRDVDRRPRISIKDVGGQTARIGGGEARYLLPSARHLNVHRGPGR